MTDKVFLPLDPLLSNELRLGIMSILTTAEYADFTYIKNTTKATSGNLSIQIDKLEKAKYIKVKRPLKARCHKPCVALPPQAHRR